MIRLGLTLSRPLPTFFNVQLEYDDQNAKVGKLIYVIISLCTYSMAYFQIKLYIYIFEIEVCVHIYKYIL